MANKRRALTTDDLMRMQEGGHAHKKRREEYFATEGSDSELEIPARLSEGSSGEGDEDVESGSGSESEDSEGQEDLAEDSDEGDEGTLLAPPLDDEDVLSSRISITPRTSISIPQKPLNIPTNHHTSFSAMGISSTLLAALAKMSIRMPTEIQIACIPPLLQGEFSTISY